ncbi:MAG: SGNH/GDSL hydrolase family protein [Tatlockia sp.]|nr:SGNH/GDSL hydrolase family protein [Tatlockia sp.]
MTRSRVETIAGSIGTNYPPHTGRLKQVLGNSESPPKKVALLGDSTLDNGCWVETETPYALKTKNVIHQTAEAFANITDSDSCQFAMFGVDGATTKEVSKNSYLSRVVQDEDHPSRRVHQLEAASEWQPDIVVLSVGGNNYREALAQSLLKKMSVSRFFLRFTPEEAKAEICHAFNKVKETLLAEYKLIIDQLIEENPKLSRIILLSQYYPSITELPSYFIYTGFSHVAHAERKTTFQAVEETMNELYREVFRYAATKDKEFVFVDVTSSLNPLGGNHYKQIEPNEKGSQIMGRLIAHAVNYEFEPLSEEEAQQPIIAMRMDSMELRIDSNPLSTSDIDSYGVKKISQFIDENRYRHLGLLFSPASSMTTRLESTYYTIGGNQFDPEYTGLFAFGLLDLSLVTIVASYLWRVAVNEEFHAAFRVIAGVVAAPILIARLIVSLALVALLALPVYGLHKVLYSEKNNESQVEFLNEEDFAFEV